MSFEDKISKTCGNVCVNAKCGHFDHNLYKTAYLAHRLILALE